MSVPDFMYYEEPSIPAGLTVAQWQGSKKPCHCVKCRVTRWFAIIGYSHARVVEQPDAYSGVSQYTLTREDS